MRGIVLFFVFKQKTAYEMRISDWSSDVCSSDLENREHVCHGWPGNAERHVEALQPHRLRRRALGGDFGAPRHQRELERIRLVPLAQIQQRGAGEDEGDGPLLKRTFEGEVDIHSGAIGRASWWEKVCQYVLIQ